MKVGDKFIRYSKNGNPSVKGTVAKLWTEYSYDLKNRIRIKRNMLESTEGTKYEENECYEIDGEISLNFLKKLREIFSRKK